MAKKQLFRTVIKLEVLSEKPIEDGVSLSEIANECDYGDFSGITKWKIINEPIVGKKAAKKVLKQGSDPEFFRMDENGNDLDSDEIKGVFVSIWDDGTEIRTNATLNDETGHIEAEQSNDPCDHGSLVREYFENEDGDEYEVCSECHCYILKTVMKDGIGSCLDECRVCSNSDCDNQ